MKVFESGSGKWVKIDQSRGIVDFKYISNAEEATDFDLLGLMSALDFADFSIYSRTLHVVAKGTNSMPHDCPTVREFIREERDKLDDGYSASGYSRT